MSDPSDRPDEPRPPSSDHELEVDLGAFLPEGSVLAGPDDEPEGPLAEAPGVDRGWGDDGDEPEVPAWARDDEPASSGPGADRPAPAPGTAPTVAAPGSPERAEAAPQAPGVADVAAPAPPTVDVAVLTRIEGDLAAVDEALAAIDAGDLGRSALLVDLVGPDLAGRTDG